MSLRRAALALPILVALAVPVSAGAASAAGGGGGGVVASGACTHGPTWKLKAKHDNGRIDVAAEVDANRVGQSWMWTLSDNTVRVAFGTAKTVAPSGSFSVHRLIANRAGVDKIAFMAHNAVTGATCNGVVSLA